MRKLIGWIQKKNKERQQLKDQHDKARLCQPCTKFCGNDLCTRVGCLNMDMRTNSLRLQLLVKRLDELTPNKQPVTKPKSVVVNLNDYRK